MTDTVRAVSRRMYEAFNTRDVAAAETIFSTDFVSHPLGFTGVAGVITSWSEMLAMFPDIRVVVEDMLVDGDRVAVRTTLHGIPGQEAPTMMEIFRVRDGRIAELWGLTTLDRPRR